MSNQTSILKTPVKIIWNITNQCGYRCAICATHSDRIPLNGQELSRAFSSILTIGPDVIKELDFSGGDPLYTADSRQQIRDAIRILGKEKVCVTTTSRGIEKAKLEKEDLKDFLYHCELTIEDARRTVETIRRERDYNCLNRRAVRENRDIIGNLVINVPVIEAQMPKRQIEEIVDTIACLEVERKSVTLIRLMPVGKLAGRHTCTTDYDPESFIRCFQLYAEKKKIPVKLQCALRARYENSSCNMLAEKIGIDCAGNVFACAWGGYVTRNAMDSPFYLGNLLQKDLKFILTSDYSQRIREQISCGQIPCQVCRYAESGCAEVFTECGLPDKQRL